MDDEIPYLPEKQVRNENQAAIQLKRCIDMPRKLPAPAITTALIPVLRNWVSTIIIRFAPS